MTCMRGECSRGCRLSTCRAGDDGHCDDRDCPQRQKREKHCIAGICPLDLIKATEVALRTMIRLSPAARPNGWRRDPGGWDVEAAHTEVTTCINTIKRLYE